MPEPGHASEASGGQTEDVEHEEQEKRGEEKRVEHVIPTRVNHQKRGLPSAPCCLQRSMCPLKLRLRSTVLDPTYSATVRTPASSIVFSLKSSSVSSVLPRSSLMSS